MTKLRAERMAANLIRNNAGWETTPGLHSSSGAVVWLIGSAPVAEKLIGISNSYQKGSIESVDGLNILPDLSHMGCDHRPVHGNGSLPKVWS